MIPLHDIVPTRERPFVTWILIAINTFVFLIELSFPQAELKSLFYLYGIVPARFTHPDWASRAGFPVGSYWPLLTSMFLHGGWMHLIGNMWSLWLFGDNVEDRMGHGKFLLFYLLSGITASLVHIFFNASSTVPTIGASGAIAGVMGAYLVMFPTARIVTLIPVFFLPLFVEIPAIIFIGFWFLSQLFSGTFSLVAPSYGGAIAWWAHVGGFLFGAMTLPVFRKRKKKYRVYYDDEVLPRRFL